MVGDADAARRGVEELLARHETEPHHVRHVCRLSLELHDALAGLHGLGPDERFLLEVGATLHDIGWSTTHPDGKGHHKESARMIREHAWRGLSSRGVLLASLVARYHRKALPDPAHEGYAGLGEGDRRRVRWLAAFLRVGDALDRRHVQRVARAEARVNGRELRITAVSTWVVDVELEAAERKGDLLRELWPGELVFDTVVG